MFDLGEIIECQSDRCRKWDHASACSRSGDVPEPFIPLWITDMDFTSLPAVIDGFRRIVEHDTSGYTWCFDELYDAVIVFQCKHRQVEVEKSRIALIYGTVSTLHYMIQAYCKPGDSVIMSTPVYDPFATAAQRQGVQVLANPLCVEESRYQLDLNLIEEQFKTYRPTSWFSCSSHNPSGKIWREEEIHQVSDPCQRYGMILMVDEVHAEHILDGKFVSCLISGCVVQDNLIVFTSPNKALKLSGLEAFYSMIPDDLLCQRFHRQLEKSSITSSNSFGVWEIILAYQHGLPWFDALNDYLQGNARCLADALQTHFPAWKMMTPELSYLAWIDASADGGSAAQLTQHFVRQAGVVIEDGNHYVQNGENYLQVSLDSQCYWLERSTNRMQ